MTKWVRADWDYRCGVCAAHIPIGAAMFVIHVDGMKRELKRCGECAGGAPPDLAPYVPKEKPVDHVESISTLGRRAYEDMKRDWKLKQPAD